MSCELAGKNMALLTMLLLIPLPAFIFAQIIGSGSPSWQVERPLSIMDGWEFFGRRLEYVMVQRTYKVAGGPNDCICVKSPYSVMMDTEKRELQKTFTYRNLSSTQKLHDDLASNVSYWPIAKFRMHFYETHVPPKQIIVRKKKYNFVNSTMIMSAYGYALQPPFWQFLYSRDTCAVVNVLPITFTYTAGPPLSGIRRKPHCELWITANLNNTEWDIKHRTKFTLCHGYFRRLCDISDVQRVYIPELCTRTQ